MKNKIEHILISLLLGLSVLLGLSFWLNITFNFNIFNDEHWTELSRLQASQIPVNNGFYISITIAIFVFLAGLFVIYSDNIKKIKIHIPHKKNDKNTQITKAQIETETQNEKNTLVNTNESRLMRPQRLNLPKNISEIAAKKHENQISKTPVSNQKQSANSDQYNQTLNDIFTTNGYIVKKNPTISGFVPNLFAIGYGEILWIGGIDCDINAMIGAVTKLQSVFQETLEDITITINPFIIDTLNQITQNDSIAIFKSIDELRTFINQNPGTEITDENHENFDAYSDYIDTIIQYIKNI